MSEREGAPYQFKNDRKIALAYTGIASDIITLDDPTADGYMGVTDARADIHILKAQRASTRGYQASDDVLVAEGALPIESGQPGKFASSEFADGTWIIRVDDQAIAREITEKGFEAGKFDELFIEHFRKAVEGALLRCLLKEKLLNNGDLNWDLLYSQLCFLGYDLLIIPSAAAHIAASGNAVGAVEAATMYAAIYHAKTHVIKTIMRVMSKLDEMRGTYNEDNFIERFFHVSSADPISRRYLEKPWEMLYPPVPIDNLIRGIIYLHRHGDELLVDRRSTSVSTS